MEDISRGVRSFTLGTAVSRVMGLAREMVFAGLFGVGAGFKEQFDAADVGLVADRA
jgi:peptidoglycan biosynthesis protein MviN/MurJ (putative lipid II flippase)